MSTPEQRVVDHRTYSQPPLGGTDSATHRESGAAMERPVVPLRRRVVERLRDYPQLRERVEGYMLAQEWRRLTDEMQSHLMQDDRVSQRDFWRDLWGLLTREQLRSAFPAALGQREEIRDDLACFKARLEKARNAARPARNPYQEPERKQIAADVLDHVDSMWNAADALATRCRDDAKDLLASLNSAVEEIFQDLEEAHDEATATERAASGGAFFERDDETLGIRQGSPSGTHGEDGVESVKAVGNQAAAADVEAHRLWP